MVKRTADKRIVLIPVKARIFNTLEALIKRHVAPKTITFIDQWKGYSYLSKYYTHKTVNHSKLFVNPENGVHTNTIEGNWAPIKQNIYKNWRTEKNFGFH
ncbi:hypothetical protein EHP00_1500 [Ecytonucleospora hepatopenaei]|uniref:ISXO2-like transposase domain-containing protein n=1 Tax=Ecytonucleospora hepatopenaei TaxID=646526 RepID=A0A1W0E3M6_9MICR|nr:hypothetical protein EHP00_1500 [Ecytonucleospora hepatopenaei]